MERSLTALVCADEWGVLTYTCHLHIIARGHRMAMMEELIRKLRHGGPTFVTMEQAVAEYRKKSPAGRSEPSRC